MGEVLLQRVRRMKATRWLRVLLVLRTVETCVALVIHPGLRTKSLIRGAHLCVTPAAVVRGGVLPVSVVAASGNSNYGGDQPAAASADGDGGVLTRLQVIDKISEVEVAIINVLQEAENVNNAIQAGTSYGVWPLEKLLGYLESLLEKEKLLRREKEQLRDRERILLKKGVTRVVPVPPFTTTVSHGIKVHEFAATAATELPYVVDHCGIEDACERFVARIKCPSGVKPFFTVHGLVKAGKTTVLWRVLPAVLLKHFPDALFWQYEVSAKLTASCRKT
eukprot:TRINITY_DN4073_c0_g1_i3.p1 TRINITY_DN4073_c0_g1~~TRINITY_DN4073_c0_g1_i3.p1  ORF type:complete len:288 (-),score=46.20 TRINITY_DN4073_c0_g1_i3:789-1622(-)